MSRFLSSGSLSLVLGITAVVAGQTAGPATPAGNAAATPAGASVGTLLERCSALRIDISLGRFIATNLRLGANRNLSMEQREGDRMETLAVNVTTTSPVVRYEFKDGQRHIIGDITADSATFRQMSEGPDPVEFLVLKQPARGPLTIRVNRSRSAAGADVTDYRGASLWHLLFAVPADLKRDLIQMLEIAHPSWRLAEMSAAIDAGLVAAARRQDLPRRAAVESLIAALASSEFRRRQSADRQLREYGPGIVPFLAAFEAKGLDSEQRLRVRAIRDALVKPVDDSPERVVAWLTTDRTIWLHFLEHADPQRRELAREHLSRLCDFSCEFDPTADEPVRTAQIARLRKRLGVN